MVQENYSKVFKEFREIVKLFPKNEYKKIPQSFINFIEENMDNNYEYNVEHIDDFQNQNMLEETRILLSIVYRDFLASPEEKEQIIKLENEQLLQYEKIKQDKYDIDVIFEKRNKEKLELQDEISVNKELIVIEEKWYKKLLNKILAFLKLQFSILVQMNKRKR